jgi:hypothetical protein
MHEYNHKNKIYIALDLVDLTPKRNLKKVVLFGEYSSEEPATPNGLILFVADVGGSSFAMEKVVWRVFSLRSLANKKTAGKMFAQLYFWNGKTAIFQCKIVYLFIYVVLHGAS